MTARANRRQPDFSQSEPALQVSLPAGHEIVPVGELAADDGANSRDAYEEMEAERDDLAARLAAERERAEVAERVVGYFAEGRVVLHTRIEPVTLRTGSAHEPLADVDPEAAALLARLSEDRGEG